MTRFDVGDTVRYIGTSIIQGVHPNSCGKILRIIDSILLTSPPKNIYDVEFDSGMTHDIIELNDTLLELVKKKEAMTEDYQDPYEIITRSWKKIVDNLEACIDAMLDDGNPQEAIKYAILLEQAVNAMLADEYSFEGKI